MKKIIIFQFILLFSLTRIMADQELPIFFKKRAEDFFSAAGREANSVFTKAADYMPTVKNQQPLLKRFEDSIYLFEKNIENAWSSSREIISKAYVQASEFVSEVAKDPSVLQKRIKLFYDQGLLFIDRHPTFSKVAGVVGVVAVVSYIRKKIIRRAVIK